MMLEKEAGVSSKKLAAADNMDLAFIVQVNCVCIVLALSWLTTDGQEFETYYNFKYGRPPKLTRKLREAGLPRKLNPIAAEYKKIEQESGPVSSKPEPTLAGKCDLGVDGSSVKKSAKSTEELLPLPAAKPQSTEEASFERLLKPIPGSYDGEFKELASIISRDIFVENPDVYFQDIVGLDRCKKLVKEAVIYPMKYPELFQPPLLAPWKGLLLYGPPGTGKTMLAKAVATECKTTFFNISASSIVSKWRGDSEKLVRVLFELARWHAPSTIFVDEIESIMSHRSSAGGEHEGSRRMKTELLVQMDGVVKSSAHVFLLAATNLPWELDVAMLRRLEKRIFVDLPSAEAREGLFAQYLPAGQVDAWNNTVVPGRDHPDQLCYNTLAHQAVGYSGSDIKLACKEALMRPLRALLEQLESLSADDAEDNGKRRVSRAPVTQDDVLRALQTTRPSCDESWIARYVEWTREFGSE
ncbi:Katanin p60 ATPase-containing subunit A-like 2 [Sorochytrium milnesiophthora]